MPKNNELANRVNNSTSGSIKVNDKRFKKPSAMIDITGAKQGYNYAIFPIKGDCLNSDKCTTKVKDGDRVLTYQISVNNKLDIISCVGKVVCILLTDGRATIKEAVFYDDVNRFLELKMYNPQEMYFKVPVEAINALFIVEKVLSKEYIEAHTISAK